MTVTRTPDSRTTTPTAVDVSSSVEAASGGTYSVSLGSRDLEPSLECIELTSVRGSRGLATVLGGLGIGALLLLIHWWLRSFSSLVGYVLYAVPCCHPVVGLTLAYLIARRRIRPDEFPTMVSLGQPVRFDGRDVGELERIEEDFAENALTLVCEAESKTLTCCSPADVATLAHEIRRLRELASERQPE